MHSEALAQAVLVTQTADAPPPHLCEFVHAFPFQDSTLCEKELPMTHMVRLAHDGTDEASRGSAIFSHSRPFHRKAGVLRPGPPNARQYRVAEQATLASPVPGGLATSRHDVPFQISARSCDAPGPPNAVPTARHQVGRTHETPDSVAGLAAPAGDADCAASAGGAACACPARPTQAPSTARQSPAADALRLTAASSENPVIASPISDLRVSRQRI